MRKRPSKENIKDIMHINEGAFKLRIELAQTKKGFDITIDEWNKAPKSLKTGKSRDPQS